MNPTPSTPVARAGRAADWIPDFGEFVTNPDASEVNPTKHGYFVEAIKREGRVNKGRWFRCTDGAGRFWECKNLIPFEITEEMRRADEYEALHGLPATPCAVARGEKLP